MGKNIRILLVRHGESMGNVDLTLYRRLPDHRIPLSPKGEEQAIEAGKAIRRFYEDKQPEHIRLWTSPYMRTRQTADGILAGAGEGLITDTREHINLCEQQFGAFDGIPEDELPARFPDAWARYKLLEEHEGRFWARYPEGESRFDVAVRVHEAFGTFHRDHERHGVSDIIVVCHGVTLRAFVMQWLHLPYEWFERERNPRNCGIRLIEGGEDKGYIFGGD